MRIGSALATLLAVLAVLAVGCKSEEKKRDDLAVGLTKNWTKCQAGLAGHVSQQLAVFCDDVDAQYVEKEVIPVLKRDCSRIREVGFQAVVVYEDRSRKRTWASIMAKQPTCEFAYEDASGR